MAIHNNRLAIICALCCTVILCSHGANAGVFEKLNKKKHNSNQQKADALVQWLRSKKGGYFSKKVAYKPIGDEEHANIGLVATKNIKRNETLIIIPRACLLTSTSNQEDSDQDMEDVKGDMCYTAWNLVREYKTVMDPNSAGKEKSPFEPYIRYIFGDPSDNVPGQSNKRQQHLPSAWSRPAKDLLHTIMGRELGPRLTGNGGSMTDTDFVFSCHHMLQDNRDHADMKFDWYDEASDARQIFQEAWWTVISRSWNDVMIPVYDIINHRNGHWHNMDQATSAHDDDNAVVVVALRDIKKGEPMHISYNECLDTDCHGLEQTYVLPSILKDYGFVEQYPRRWRIAFDDFDYGAEAYEDLVFEIDQLQQGLTLTWLSPSSPEPSLPLEQVAFLRGHLNRQRDLQEAVKQGVDHLESEHEKEVILEYHQALTTALQMIINQSNSKQQENEEECAADSPPETCQAPHFYDDLAQLTQGDGDEDEEEEEGVEVCSGDKSAYLGNARYETIDETNSHYQGIRFDHNFEVDETCLYLSDWLQTCSSFRPHYHEAVVHIPASFVDEVKRVIYLGGGDNMMLHEILKYPSLELVMGFELDQQVVRSAFKSLGTQPHFDNEKVQWWFGDATKSLSMLPADYWGTFDLVIVDLQTNVAETLQVTKDMTIMDAAMHLLKTDGGVLSRNEDFYPRRSVGFAKYEVDLELFDVPVLCQQSITMGSKNVDFLRKAPNDHKIDTVYLNKNKKQVNQASARFGDWFNYRNNRDQVNPICQEKIPEERDGEELEGMDRSKGFHLILEVEEASLSNASAESVRESIRKALAKAGLQQKAEAVSSSDENITLFLLQEGYVLAQSSWAEEEYIAFDVKVWSDYDKAEAAKAALVDAVGGSSSSSYRIVAGGMSGLSKDASSAGTVPGSLCEEKPATDITQALEEATLGVITREVIALAQATDSAVAVICADDSSPCRSLEALEKQKARLITVRACSGLSEASGDSVQEMATCGDETLSVLQGSASTKGKIGAIVIDSGAPKAMGQILHKILSDKSLRVNLLDEKYVVVALSSDPSPSWRGALMERFQTDFDSFSPAYRSQVFFNGTTSSLELGLFSSGDSDFFSHLGTVLQSVERETGLSGEVRKVVDGMINYVADFHPTIVSTNDDYDLSDSSEQWSSQAAMEHQTIFQFEVQPQLTQLKPKERVLVEYTQDVWKGTWYPGRVMEELENEVYIVVLDDGEEEIEVVRSSIRRYETDSTLEEREMVLIRRDDYWSQGAVIEKATEVEAFSVRLFDSNGDVMTVQRQDLVRRMEASDLSHVPSMSSSILRTVFTNALDSFGIDFVEGEMQSFDQIVGAGSIIVTFWPTGLAIATWDGQTHVEFNLFTEGESKKMRDDFSQTILVQAPFLLMTSRDELPRGFGRVVNFPSDLETDPHWAELDDESDD